MAHTGDVQLILAIARPVTVTQMSGMHCSTPSEGTNEKNKSLKFET